MSWKYLDNQWRSHSTIIRNSKIQTSLNIFVFFFSKHFTGCYVLICIFTSDWWTVAIHKHIFWSSTEYKYKFENTRFFEYDKLFTTNKKALQCFDKISGLNSPYPNSTFFPINYAAQVAHYKNRKRTFFTKYTILQTSEVSLNPVPQTVHNMWSLYFLKASVHSFAVKFATRIWNHQLLYILVDMQCRM